MAQMPNANKCHKFKNFSRGLDGIRIIRKVGFGAFSH
jgi:hypothetical protein